MEVSPRPCPGARSLAAPVGLPGTVISPGKVTRNLSLQVDSWGLHTKQKGCWEGNGNEVGIEWNENGYGRGTGMGM